MLNILLKFFCLLFLSAAVLCTIGTITQLFAGSWIAAICLIATFFFTCAALLTANFADESEVR